MKKTNKFSKILEYLPLILILISAFCLYTYKLDLLPPGLHGDEAEPGLEALKIIKGEYKSVIGVGWYNIPLANFILPAIAIQTFGQNVIGLRIGSVLIGTITLIPFYFLCKLIFRNNFVSFLSVVFLATTHYYIAFSRLGLINIQTIFWEILSFYFILRALTEGRRILYILAGLSTGLGLYSYLNFRVVPIIVLFIILHKLILSPKKIKLVINFFYFLASAVIIFSPMLFYYYKHPGAFLSRTMASFIFSNDSYVHSHIGNIYRNKNGVEIIFLQAKELFNLSSNSGDTSDRYGYHGRIFDPATLVLISIGLLLIFSTIKKLPSFFLAVWPLLTLALFGILTIDPPFWPRLIGLLPAVAIYMGLAIKTIYEKLENLKLNIAKIPLKLILGALVVSIVAFNIYAYFIEYPKYMPDHVGSRIASAMNSLTPDYKVFFLTAPYFYSNHSSIVFQAPKIRATTLENPQRFIPYKATEKIAFIIYPQYLEIGLLLSRLNPEGELDAIKNIHGQVQFYLFKTI